MRRGTGKPGPPQNAELSSGFEVHGGTMAVEVL